MRAAHVTALTGPSGIHLVDVPAPVRADREVLVAVKAVAPAFPDLLLSRGEYQLRPNLPFSPGADFAGVVLQAPTDSEFTPGMRVAGCLNFGAAAEQVSVPIDRVYPLPDGVDLITGAALPMNYLTAHYALIRRGGLCAGERVIVTGASGGVGSAVVQIAAGLGANVTAVVSGTDRSAVAFRAGARQVIIADQLPERAFTLNAGHGFDMVVDVVGGDVRPLLQSLAPHGRLMAVGFASGGVPNVNVSRLLLTNTDIRGVESAHLWAEGTSAEAWSTITDLLKRGHVMPLVQRAGTLDDYAAALGQLASRRNTGRLVLTV
jgi:NADPH2:quinone reductase